MQDVLDHAVLDELFSFVDDGDPDLLLDLIQLFLDDSPSKVLAVQEGVANGDFEKAERAAHSLKGSSGNLGARGVQDVCELLQNASGARRLQECQRLAPLLAEQYAAAALALQQVLADHRN